MELLKPSVDFVFKRIFGIEENKDIHMIELQKLREVSVGQQRKLVRWMLFLLGPTPEKWGNL